MNANDYVYPRTISKHDFITYFHYKNGKVLGNSNTCEPMVFGAIVEKVFDEDAYRAAVKVYQQERVNVNERFKQDLFEHLGITNHPKCDRFFVMCDDGDGFQAIIDNAEKWVALLL